jgi:hypothetical protein
MSIGGQQTPWQCIDMTLRNFTSYAKLDIVADLEKQVMHQNLTERTQLFQQHRSKRPRW